MLSVARINNLSTLKVVVHIVTTGCQRVKRKSSYHDARNCKRSKRDVNVAEELFRVLPVHTFCA
jgi:hypothetical protein